MNDSSAPLRIGNASGFYGDRHAAVHEMLTGGELDVLTGDYLAELTMLILAMDRLKRPERGYARSFLRQMEESLGLAVDAGVKVVVNAGGLNPAGLAAELRAQSERIGVPANITHVEGDDLLARADELGLGSPLAVNAYLGGFGIAEALRGGADVVVTGRVTDASLAVGPAIAHFGWSPTDHDALAGAMVAGHVIECGTQATGGNYSRFTEIADLVHPGFPIAEVFADGSSAITKHPGTGGAVTVDTVTAQLLYEIGGARYAGPDATARFDTIDVVGDGPDRVRITGVRGEAPPPTLKVGVNQLGGYRNEVVFVLTGLDIEAKAALIRSQMEPSLPEHTIWTLARTDRPDADVQQEASALLQCVVRSADADDVGRRFSGAAIELALASYPGFHVTAPPSNGSPYGVFVPTFVPQAEVPHVVVAADGSRTDIPAATDVLELTPLAEPALPDRTADGSTRRMPLGAVALARSGDKGGSANVGLWVRTDEAFAWLVHTLTVEQIKVLLPELADLTVARHVLPNLRALNFVIDDLLGEGVSSNARFDPQAKAVGEWLLSRHLDIPEALPVTVLRSTLDPRTDSYRENRESLLAKIADVDTEHAKAVAGGGEKYVERHRGRGKLLIRERIELLIDEDSPFLELSGLAGWGSDFTVGASVVCGIGVVNGVECMIGGSDPTIKGGASNPWSLRKVLRANEIALQNRLPCINLTESGGADLPTQKEIFIPGGAMFRDLTRLSAAGIPVISIVFGNSTAGGAYIPGMSDYVVMIKERSKVFLAGPPLVKMATGEDADDESLGGADMHARVSGLADYFAVDEHDAIRLGRRIVARLNWHKKGPAPAAEVAEPRFDADELLGLVPTDLKVPFDPREVIARVVDDSDFDEFKPLYGTSLVTGWAQLHGYPVGILANARGVLFSEESQKAAQFIQLANQIDVPLLFLQNTTGYMVGEQYERGGMIKHGAMMVNAVSNSKVPHITVAMGASYGAGNYGMCGRAYEPRFLFTWPNAKSAVMGPAQLAGVISIVSRQSAESRGLPFDEEADAVIRQMVEDQIETESMAMFLSGRMLDDGIIDPRDTRTVLGMALSAIHSGPVKGADGFGVFRM